MPMPITMPAPIPALILNASPASVQIADPGRSFIADTTNIASSQPRNAETDLTDDTRSADKQKEKSRRQSLSLRRMSRAASESIGFRRIHRMSVVETEALPSALPVPLPSTTSRVFSPPWIKRAHSLAPQSAASHSAVPQHDDIKTSHITDFGFGSNIDQNTSSGAVYQSSPNHQLLANEPNGATQESPLSPSLINKNSKSAVPLISEPVTDAVITNRAEEDAKHGAKLAVENSVHNFLIKSNSSDGEKRLFGLQYSGSINTATSVLEKPLNDDSIVEHPQYTVEETKNTTVESSWKDIGSGSSPNENYLSSSVQFNSNTSVTKQVIVSNQETSNQQNLPISQPLSFEHASSTSFRPVQSSPIETATIATTVAVVDAHSDYTQPIHLDYDIEAGLRANGNDEYGYDSNGFEAIPAFSLEAELRRASSVIEIDDSVGEILDRVLEADTNAAINTDLRQREFLELNNANQEESIHVLSGPASQISETAQAFENTLNEFSESELENEAQLDNEVIFEQSEENQPEQQPTQQSQQQPPDDQSDQEEPGPSSNVNTPPPAVSTGGEPDPTDPTRRRIPLGSFRMVFLMQAPDGSIRVHQIPIGFGVSVPANEAAEAPAPAGVPRFPFPGTFGSRPPAATSAAENDSNDGMAVEEALEGGENNGGGGGPDYDALVRLAELIGPARPRFAHIDDVREQLPLVHFKAALISNDPNSATTVRLVNVIDAGSSAAAAVDLVVEDEKDLSEVEQLKGLLGETKEKCSICLMNYDEGEEMRILKCHHGFHLDCIDQWLTSHVNSCPICRQPGVEISRTPVEQPNQNFGQSPNQPPLFLEFLRRLLLGRRGPNRPAGPDTPPPETARDPSIQRSNNDQNNHEQHEHHEHDHNHFHHNHDHDHFLQTPPPTATATPPTSTPGHATPTQRQEPHAHTHATSHHHSQADDRETQTEDTPVAAVPSVPNNSGASSGGPPNVLRDALLPLLAQLFLRELIMGGPGNNNEGEEEDHEQDHDHHHHHHQHGDEDDEEAFGTRTPRTNSLSPRTNELQSASQTPIEIDGQPVYGPPPPPPQQTAPETSIADILNRVNGGPSSVNSQHESTQERNTVRESATGMQDSFSDASSDGQEMDELDAALMVLGRLIDLRRQIEEDQDDDHDHNDNDENGDEDNEHGGEEEDEVVAPIVVDNRLLDDLYNADVEDDISIDE
ncbi:hypothetical protein HK100_005599 [Physocladia obscura]|uniref:RING-type domain-containing protein n=1 Tax=Physocladia obscura TaxID=109957 RepID=A0AAD5SRH7_9FUNG|nr:hypothetical protein HK100_005599 [Physocladia obscura]